MMLFHSMSFSYFYHKYACRDNDLGIRNDLIKEIKIRNELYSIKIYYILKKILGIQYREFANNSIKLYIHIFYT